VRIASLGQQEAVVLQLLAAGGMKELHQLGDGQPVSLTVVDIENE
jgi:hypothetical protein